MTSVSRYCWQLAAGPFMVHRHASNSGNTRTQSDSWKERRVCCVSCSKNYLTTCNLSTFNQNYGAPGDHFMSIHFWVELRIKPFLPVTIVFFHTLMWAPVFHSVSLSKESALDTIHYKVNLPPFTSWETAKTREARNWKDKTQLSGCCITFFLYVLTREASKLLDSF